MNTSLRKTLTTLQTFSKYIQLRKITQTTVIRNMAVPQPDGQPKTFSPKIEEIANNIAKLNLIEVAELTDLLKKKLNIPDAPLMGYAAAAPVAAEPQEEEQTGATQTSFTVKLLKYDEKQKVALIKEIKNNIEGMNLVQAKKFVESAPVIIKDNIGKDDAEKLKELLTKAGGEVEVI